VNRVQIADIATGLKLADALGVSMDDLG